MVHVLCKYALLDIIDNSCLKYLNKPHPRGAVGWSVIVALSGHTHLRLDALHSYRKRFPYAYI